MTAEEMGKTKKSRSRIIQAQKKELEKRNLEILKLEQEKAKLNAQVEDLRSSFLSALKNPEVPNGDTEYLKATFLPTLQKLENVNREQTIEIQSLKQEQIKLRKENEELYDKVIDLEDQVEDLKIQLDISLVREAAEDEE